MFKKSIYLCILTLLFAACSSEDNSPMDPDDKNDELPDQPSGNMNASDIGISINEGNVLTDGDIVITMKEDVVTDILKVYLGDSLIAELSGQDLDFNIDPGQFPEGEHVLKIEAFLDGNVIARRLVPVKIDRNGPIVILEDISDGEVFCGKLEFSPSISDAVSAVTRVSVFVNDSLLIDFADTTDFSFSLDAEILDPGFKKIKFEMEDASGNISTDSVEIALSQKLLDINIPQGFIRTGIEKFHVILSDTEGEHLGSATFESGLDETLEICSLQSLDTSEEFMLTFITDFEDKVFSIFNYQNLSKALLGSGITLAKRAGGLAAATVEIDLPDYEAGYYVRSEGPWSNSFNYGSQDLLSGHISKNFTVESLGTDMSFVMNFNPDIARSYSFAFVEDAHTIFRLGSSDFNNTDVIHDNLLVYGSSSDPYLSIYGFENQEHFNGMVSHMLYWNASLNNLNNYDYSYASIFENIFHSIKVSNYSVEGLGHPPASVTVPGNSIDYSFNGNSLDVTGLPDYEVGRAQLRYIEDVHILLEVYFDGQDEHIKLPQMPEQIFSQTVVDVFKEERLEFKQTVMENYEGIGNYDDYISRVFIPSVPFYTVAPQRERVFKSSVSTSLLPMTEFPFHDRF